MKYLLVLLLIGSCSHFKSQPELSGSAKDVPGWVYAPYEECQEDQELCATGEAKTYAQADGQAKANLASIFEVQIRSDLNVNTSSSQGMPWQAEVRQEVQQSLKESVDQILETVQIKKRFKKDGLSYALASLDRSKASELIGGRLSRIDQELETLWARRQRTNLRKIVKLVLEREKINERYSIVSGSPRPAKVKFEDVIKWKDSRPKVVPLVLRVGQAPDWMREKVKELLTESGFKLVNGESAKALTLNVDSIKEFLNVEGFEKYTFTLHLTSIEDGEKKKVLSTSETVTGRNQADALLKVKGYFTDYLEQHLAELHLD